MDNLKKIPKFKTIAEENIFWQQHDSIDYFDWTKAKLTSFPNLKSSTKQVLKSKEKNGQIPKPPKSRNDIS